MVFFPCAVQVACASLPLPRTALAGLAHAEKQLSPENSAARLRFRLFARQQSPLNDVLSNLDPFALIILRPSPPSEFEVEFRPTIEARFPTKRPLTLWQ